jgi:endonuclease-3 related protein
MSLPGKRNFVPESGQTNHNVLETIYAALYDTFGQQHWWPGNSPLEIAAGAILTQNTNWTNVEKAIRILKKERLLSVQALDALAPERLATLIRPAGYYNIKAKRLKNFIRFLIAQYRGNMGLLAREDLPVIRKKLLSVNGIGPETADSIILYALRRPVFVIDAYTKRIFSRHGILGNDLSYEACQQMFHAGLKNNVQLFNEYHALLVRLAKDFCRTTPRCSGCPLEGV